MAREMDIKPDFKFQFTRSWFKNRNLSTFREYIYPEWHDKPCVYLELGVFEGMSMVWMAQHVLVHPQSRGIGIDPWLMTTKLDSDFMEGVKARAEHNTRPYRKKVTLQRASSAEALRKMLRRGGFLGLAANTVDLCMVDGNHNALAVLDDLRLVHKLVRPGGWILCDDVENDIPKQDHVAEGLRLFLEEGHSLSHVFKHKYVECYKKV